MAEYELLLGDCLDWMPIFPDHAFDAIVTDPPYGVGMDYNTYDDTPENWQSLFLRMMPHFKRLAGMTVMPSCQIRMLEFIYDSYPPDWLICWHKGSPGHRAYVGFNDWEPLLVYGKNPGVQMHDFFTLVNTEQMGNYGHPCPKPVRWATWLIERMTRPGDTVFDPFMGSGTTGVAAVMLGRKFVGCELDPEYFSIAEERIFKASQQPLLLVSDRPIQEELFA